MEEFVLEENGVYTSKLGDLIQIKKIDLEKDTVHMFNITKYFNVWLEFSKLKKNKTLVKRVR